MKRISHIEAVTVCVGYHDFLQETAKWNLPYFEEWIICTTPEDERTREVCRRFNLKTILSEDHRRHANKPDGWQAFNKGRMIERALQHTSASGWRIHLDGDLVLPHRFRLQLEAAELLDDTIYGIDRIMVKNWPDWQKLIATGYLQGGHFDYHCRNEICPPGFRLGTRWSHPQMGYVPIGFFQMWHSSQDEWRGVRVKPYPMNHSTACRTDVQHGLQWDRHKRSLIPEVIGAHLESEPSEKGANWGGRTTGVFGPDGCHHKHHKHHKHHHPKPYND